MVVGVDQQLGSRVLTEVQCRLQRVKATEDDGVLDGHEASGAKTGDFAHQTLALLSSGLFEAVDFADVET